MSKVEGNIFQSDVGGKEGKEGYIGLLFGHLARMSFALNNSELANQSGNIYYNSLLIIHHVPDSELRKELSKKLKERIAELKKDGKEESAAVTTASIEIVGDVMDHIDEMLGIEKRAKISIELDCYSCKYKRAVEDMEDNEEISDKEEEIPNEMSEDVPIKISELGK
jgi:predicted house-cleaning noncanonical NTP pyrophosphatase (MazG superfamily)